MRDNKEPTGRRIETKSLFYNDEKEMPQFTVRYSKAQKRVSGFTLVQNNPAQTTYVIGKQGQSYEQKLEKDWFIVGIYGYLAEKGYVSLDVTKDERHDLAIQGFGFLVAKHI